MDASTFLGFSGALAVFFGILFLAFTIIALLMPIFVFFIYTHTRKIMAALESMEDMMRNGK